MTAKYFVYFFDTANYTLALKPLVRNMLSEDYSELQALATTIARLNPDLWQELIYWRYSPDDLGNEEVEFDWLVNRVDFWMTIILMAYCTRVPIPRDYNERMREVKKICGSSLIDRILWGDDLQTFYEITLGEISTALNIQINAIPSWCKRGLVYWLDYTEIGKLIQWIKEYKACFPDGTIEIAEQTLTRAYQEQKGLLMATLD